MPRFTAYLRSDAGAGAILFLCSLGIYFFYFHHVFLHMNDILSSITLDSIKNYYTFAYHIRNDHSFLSFSGMNYPFGEHVIYTDCHPLLSGLLQLFPFVQPYSIGILHAVLFISFIITPNILLKIFSSLNVQRLPAFLFSLSIALLSPQFQKINGGHHALAYGCVFPVSILLLIGYFRQGSLKHIIAVFLYNLALFFIHPYLGFALCVFSLITILTFDLFSKDRRRRMGLHAQNFVVSILPLIIFRIFMAMTDQHKDRPLEPYGSDVLVENTGSLLAPAFGPFREMLEKLSPEPTQHFEGHSYLGMSTILLVIILLARLPFILRNRVSAPMILSVLLSSFVLLLISFGYHLKLMAALHISVPEIKQFRAVSRFSWIFYFALPCAAVVLLSRSFSSQRGISLFRGLAILCFILSISEASSYFQLHEGSYWKFRNFFNPSLLNEDEKKVLASIRENNSQALLPLPLFHGGSEMYDRPGSSNSMVPAMLYSYHSGKPVISMMASRTSISETEALIETLNSYKSERQYASLFSDDPITILRTRDELLPDETRLYSSATPALKLDTLEVASISTAELFRKKIRHPVKMISRDFNYPPDSGLIYIRTEDRKPFRTANMDDYEKILELPAGHRLPDGKYIVSFHYYYPCKQFQWLSVNLIIAEGEDENYRWIQNIPVRNLSGFYDGFGVFEYFFEVRQGERYEFILKGLEGRDYHISDFLIRPAQLDVSMSSSAGRLLNNFPE